MPEHNFTLILAGDLDAHMDALYEAGCDDATFGEIDGVPYAEFDREAETFGSAVRSAITDVESVEGLRVIRVEPDDLVTAAEIAERLGRTRESVRLLISGRRGRGDFPHPASHTRSRNRLWRWSEVAAWAEYENQLEGANLIAALNAGLDLRDRMPVLAEPEREIVADLTISGLGSVTGTAYISKNEVAQLQEGSRTVKKRGAKKKQRAR